MSERFKGLVSFLFVAMLLLVLPAVSMADITPDMLNEGEPAFTFEEAQVYITEIVPLVEQATERKFLKIPKLVITDRQKMTAILNKELNPQLANLYPDVPAEQLELLSQNQAAALSVSLMGKYGVLDGKLYLLPKNLPSLLKLAKSDLKNAKSLLKLVIAHELTHALQDQQVDLKRSNKITDMDELKAFSATVEGQAVWVQETVGRQLGLEDSVVEMSRLMSAGAIKFEDPALDMINKAIAAQYEQIYFSGGKFINYIYRQGGNQRVWEILAKPPLKTSMIINPETYSETPQAKLDYSILFDSLDNELAGQDLQVQNFTLGHMELQSSYALMAENGRNEILAQVQHVQSFIAQSNEEDSMLTISAIEVKEAKFFPTYIRLLEEMAQNNVKILESSTSMRIVDFQIFGFTALQSDIAHKIAVTISVNENFLGQTFVRICKGNLMLEFVLVNYKMDDEEIAQLAGKIFNFQAGQNHVVATFI